MPEIGQYSSALAPVGVEPISAAKGAVMARLSPYTAYASSNALGIEYLQHPSGSAWCRPTMIVDIADYHGTGWGGTPLDKERSAATLMGVTRSRYSGLLGYLPLLTA